VLTLHTFGMLLFIANIVGMMSNDVNKFSDYDKCHYSSRFCLCI